VDTIEALQREAPGHQFKIEKGGPTVQGRISSVEISEEDGLITIYYRWIAVKKGFRWHASKKGHFPTTFLRSWLPNEVEKKENGCIVFLDSFGFKYTIMTANSKNLLNPYGILGMPQARLV
jgi:hypothetical protein